MTVSNVRHVVGPDFLYRVLRGFWEKQADGKKLFGRFSPEGERPAKQKSCQKRLPDKEFWDVSRAADRKLERRTLKHLDVITKGVLYLVCFW